MQNRTVKRSVIINATPQQIWKAITDPDMIRQYFFGTNVKTDWKEGSTITYWGTWKGRDYEDKGRIIKVENERLLEHTHWSSLSGTEDKPENYFHVIYEIDPREKDSVLCITQEGCMTEDAAAHSEQNWDMVLHNLKELVEKKDIPLPV